MPYMLMFASSTFFAYLASYHKRRDVIIFFSLICILIPSIMGGLRSINVGFDTHFYGFPHFMRACNSPDFLAFLMSDGRMSKEILWAALTYFSAKLTGNFNFNIYVLIGAMFHVSAVIVVSYFLAFYMLATWETKHTKLKNTLLYPLGMKRVFSKGEMYKFFQYSLLFHIIYRFFVRIIANRMPYYYFKKEE